MLALGLLSGILLLVLYRQGLICSSKKDSSSSSSAAAKKKASGKKEDKDRLSKAFPEMFHSHRGRRRDEGRGGEHPSPPPHHHHGRSRHQNKSPQPPQHHHHHQIGVIAHMPRERSNSGSPQTPRQPHHVLIPAGQPEPGGSRCKTPDSIDGPVNSAVADKMTGLAKLGNALYLKDMDQVRNVGKIRSESGFCLWCGG